MPLNERRLLARALLALAALGLLALLAAGWQFARGPRPDATPPSVRTARLPAGSHLWADAPRLPPGLQLGPGLRLKVLLLRLPDGRLRAFYAPAVQGRPTLPLGAAPLNLATPGLPCDDFAPDFDRGDIACRQPSPGFEFALRHRWTLEGQPLTTGTPPLPAAAGQEVDGDWLPGP